MAIYIQYFWNSLANWKNPLIIMFYNLNISFLLIFDIASRVKIANIWFQTSDIYTILFCL